MPAGYSNTPTAKKLGIKPDHVVCVLNGPRNYQLLVDGLPAGVRIARTLLGHADLVHIFVTRVVDLAGKLSHLRTAIFPDGAIWVSWPKRASKVSTDLTEDVVRRLAFANGLVDVKVCAVDHVWSGLKLVVPVADRGRTTGRLPMTGPTDTGEQSREARSVQRSMLMERRARSTLRKPSKHIPSPEAGGTSDS